MISELLGVKFSHAIGGLAGGLVSLRHFSGLGWLQQLFIVAAAGLSAAYLAPLLMYCAAYLGHDLSIPEYNAGAFLIGYLSINVLAGVFKWTEFFKRNPHFYLPKPKKPPPPPE